MVSVKLQTYLNLLGVSLNKIQFSNGKTPQFEGYTENFFSPEFYWTFLYLKVQV
jgi:hypothetical protein